MSLYTLDYELIRETAKGILSSGLTPAVWQAENAYSENGLVKPTDDNLTGYFYRAIEAGASGVTEPVWPEAFGEEITDGTVKWRQEDPVYIKDFFPDDFSYPCVVLGDIRPISEIQMATGNIPASELRLDVDIISYQAKASKKTFYETRQQGYDLMKQVQNLIRLNPNFGHIQGILRATSGVYTLDDDMPPVMWRMRVLWLIRIMAKR